MWNSHIIIIFAEQKNCFSKILRVSRDHPRDHQNVSIKFNNIQENFPLASNAEWNEFLVFGTVSVINLIIEIVKSIRNLHTTWGFEWMLWFVNFQMWNLCSFFHEIEIFLRKERPMKDNF